jgi:hypothetical protein
MCHEDRDWYREDRKRRDKLIWNEKSGELEFDRPKGRRRWRWPYRLRSDLPWWIAESLRIFMFMLPIVLAYYAWKYFQ